MEKLMIDLGRQTLIHGNRVPVEEMCAKIDSLTLEVCPPAILPFCHEIRANNIGYLEGSNESLETNF
jgi:hypothetical protein